MNESTKKIVMTALFSALTCVATMIIKIPSPLKGYINLGDCIVLLAGWMLSPVYGFIAAGLGSALADLFSGYVIYVPATFLIKGLMAIFVTWLGMNVFVIRLVAAVLVIVANYFISKLLVFRKKKET